ncbi:glutathione S-transferase family protein (plasmid) [Sphingobium sp. SJ10-10]|uniref:glutathione S-transferase family protein n=1 Tax=Sphingobium sp. SJ10-10 TaxID=3114999 RepID=UPI002E1934A8|nr:glutathione S-transferase family protein [Sphingobium sp. SJ10-10]
MIKIYHILPTNDTMGGSRNAAKVSIALREIGEAFEIIDLNRERDLRPSQTPFKKDINPNGVTPAIDDNGFLLWESSAILRYLADTRAALISDDLRCRAIAQQWLAWEASTFQPSFLSYYFAVSSAQEDNTTAAETQYQYKLQILEDALKRSGGFLAGEYSIADIAVGAIVPIGFHLGIDLRGYPSIVQWLATLSNRPAWKSELSFQQDMSAGRSSNLI